MVVCKVRKAQKPCHPGGSDDAMSAILKEVKAGIGPGCRGLCFAPASVQELGGFCQKLQQDVHSQRRPHRTKWGCGDHESRGHGLQAVALGHRLELVSGWPEPEASKASRAPAFFWSSQVAKRLRPVFVVIVAELERSCGPAGTRLRSGWKLCCFAA